MGGMHLGFQNDQGLGEVVEQCPCFSDADSGRSHGGMGAVQAEAVTVTLDNTFRPANGARPVLSIMNQQPVA